MYKSREFQEFCARLDHLFAANALSEVTIVVGYSGGADSTLLLLWLSQYRERKKERRIWLYALQVAHGWGKYKREWGEFENDAAKKGIHFCYTLNVPFFYYEEEDFSIKNSSLEATGRALRKKACTMIKEKTHAQYIAVGHNEDDCIETFFISLFREGMNGIIKPMTWITDEKIIRPLLFIKKVRIIELLIKHGVPFLVDPSNEDEQFLRGKIRSSLIPALEKCDERARSAIIAYGEHVVTMQSIYAKAIEEKINRCLVQGNDKSDEYITINLIEFFQIIDHQIIDHQIIDQRAMLRSLLNLLIQKSNEAIDKHILISQRIIEEMLQFFHNKKSNHHTIGIFEVKKTKNTVIISIYKKHTK